MVHRRRFLAGVGALTACSGCVGVITGESALSFESSEATVTASAASDAGYEQKGVKTQTISREFTVAGQTRQVEVANQVATYEKSLSFGPLGEAKLGVFALISTPSVEIAGKTFNPIGDYDNDRLVDMVASQYENLRNVRRVETRTTTMLGSKVDVSKYVADSTFAGTTIEVCIHVTKTRDGPDFVVPVAVYPKLKSGEEEHVFFLLGNVRHSTE